LVCRKRIRGSKVEKSETEKQRRRRRMKPGTSEGDAVKLRDVL
jgi:hypothetical protein